MLTSTDYTHSNNWPRPQSLEYFILKGEENALQDDGYVRIKYGNTGNWGISVFLLVKRGSEKESLSERFCERITKKNSEMSWIISLQKAKDFVLLYCNLQLHVNKKSRPLPEKKQNFHK